MIDHAALQGAAGISRGGKDGVRLLAKGELTAKVSFSVDRRQQGRDRRGRKGRRVGRSRRALKVSEDEKKHRSPRSHRLLQGTAATGQEGRSRQGEGARRPRLPNNRETGTGGGGCISARSLYGFAAEKRGGGGQAPVRPIRAKRSDGITLRQYCEQSQPRQFRRRPSFKQRIWFTVGALIVFRFMSFVPLPGIDPIALKRFFDTNSGGILDLFNMFSGGALSNYSLISLSIMPYITASIVVQLAASLHPALAAIKKEGESGRKKLNQYTRYGTVFLCLIQGFRGGEERAMSRAPRSIPARCSTSAGIISLIGGTMFLLWLGEQITSRGIGNGVSLIIMAGIVSRFPTLPPTCSKAAARARPAPS